MDCTRIRIICPKKCNTMAFKNRKNFYSANVQPFYDGDAVIITIVTSWPGWTSDLRIFENSKIAEKLKETIDGIPWGDSRCTCACRAFLRTPILKPKNREEMCYIIGALSLLLRDASVY